MEFFDLLNYPQLILQYLPWNVQDEASYVSAVRLNLIICLAVAAGVYLIELILGGIGLGKMAKRAGIKHSLLAYLPILNTWYAGKIAGEANFFGQKMKRAGLYSALLELVYSAIEVVIIVFNFMLMNPAYYTYEPSTMYEGMGRWVLSGTLMGADKWIYESVYYLNLVSYLLWFLVLIFFCVLFTAFFRKYYARSPFLMTVLCTILPFRGVAVFAVRNNTPVDYREYMRRRAEEYRRYTPYGGYNQGGNGGYDQGGNGGYNQGGNSGSDPFPDYGGGNSGNSGNDSGRGNSGGGDQGGGNDDSPFSDFN